MEALSREICRSADVRLSIKDVRNNTVKIDPLHLVRIGPYLPSPSVRTSFIMDDPYLVEDSILADFKHCSIRCRWSSKFMTPFRTCIETCYILKDLLVLWRHCQQLHAHLHLHTHWYHTVTLLASKPVLYCLTIGRRAAVSCPKGHRHDDACAHSLLYLNIVDLR